MAPNPADTINLMRGEGVLKHILPRTGDIGRLRTLAWLETTAIKVEGVAPDGVRRLVSVLDLGGDDALDIVAEVADRWRLSNEQRARLFDAVPGPQTIDPEMGAPTLRQAIFRTGSQAVRDRALLAWAAELVIDPRLVRARTQGWRDILTTIAEWTPPTFPIGGKDALELGVNAGPRVGRLLATVEAWWKEGDFAADRQACLDKLKILMGSNG